MSMYAKLKTDAKLERDGVLLDYGEFRVRVARAGGANHRFAKALERNTRPYRRAIQTEMLPEERAAELMINTFAEAVVLGWETKVEGEWVEGIEAPDGGELLPVTAENISLTFRNLPDLFSDVREQTSKAMLFREHMMEEDAGN